MSLQNDKGVASITIASKFSTSALVIVKRNVRQTNEGVCNIHTSVFVDPLRFASLSQISESTS